MSVTLYDDNLQEIEMPGVRWLEFTPEELSAEEETEKVHHGEIPLGRTLNARRINARMLFDSQRRLGYKLMKMEIGNVLNPLRDVWAVDEEVPGIMWRVSVESHSVERINGTHGEAVVTFKSAKPYARSIGTSLDPATYGRGLWDYGAGMQDIDGPSSFIHSGGSFMIRNPGTVDIDPRENELVIKLTSSTATASGNLRIINDTTGDEWRYTGPLNAGDVITIDGILSKRNGLNIVGDTAPGFGLVTLRTKNNAIRVTGLNGEFEITFDFPFLYN